MSRGLSHRERTVNNRRMSDPSPHGSRYHRQTLLPGIGVEGQARLAASHVVLVGVGALGCASADMLARAGVGRLTLIDRDVVEWSNLQRQTLFDEADAVAGTPKAVAAAQRLGRVNSAIAVEPIVADLSARNASRLLSRVVSRVMEGVPGGGGRPVLVDGCDNFETRYLLNDLAVKHGLAYVYGGVVGTHGMQATFAAGPGWPCLRCVFAEPPAPGTSPTCDTAGVLGPAVSMVAAAQATDAIKVLLGRTDLVSRTLLDVDLWTNDVRRVDISGAKQAACPCCGSGGDQQFSFLDADAAALDGAAALCGSDAVQVFPRGDVSLDLIALSDRLAALGVVTRSRFMLRVTVAAGPDAGVAPTELTVFADGRAIVRGTTDPGVARSVYARYVGA